MGAQGLHGQSQVPELPPLPGSRKGLRLWSLGLCAQDFLSLNLSPPIFNSSVLELCVLKLSVTKCFITCKTEARFLKTSANTLRGIQLLNIATQCCYLQTLHLARVSPQLAKHTNGEKKSHRVLAKFITPCWATFIPMQGCI